MEHHASLHKTITWRAPEYVYKKKTLLWYTHVSVFFFLIFFFFFMLENIPGILIVAFLFWYFMAKADERPKIVEYTLDHTGLSIDEHHFNYSEFHSFTIEGTHENPVIVLDLNYYLAMPVTVVPKKGEAEAIVDLLLQYVPLRTEFSLIRWLTHKLHY